MIFKYDVKEINNKKYIIGSWLLSEKGKPGKEYEFQEAFDKELVDDNDKLQWTIRNNTDYDPEIDPISTKYLIENNPEPFTPDEITQREERANKELLAVSYPQDRILELQDQAIQALAKGEGLPNEYLVYVAYKESVYAR